MSSTGSRQSRSSSALAATPGHFRPIPRLSDYFVDDDPIWGGAASGLANLLARAGVISGCDPPVNQHICPSEPLQRGQIAKMLVNTLALNAPDSFRSPWTDTATRFYHRAARIAAYHGLWDSSNGLFEGRTPVTRAEFARVVVTALGLDPCPSRPVHRGPSTVSFHAVSGPGVRCICLRHENGMCLLVESGREAAHGLGIQGHGHGGNVVGGSIRRACRDLMGTGPTATHDHSFCQRAGESTVEQLWGIALVCPAGQDLELTQTTTVGDDGAAWGRTTTSAKDQGDLVRQVILGDWGPLERADREIAWDLMTSVVSEQTWGITRGVPEGWTVGQKNGFAGGVANSVGYVARPGRQGGYVIAVLTNGWSSWERGVRTVDEISSWVADSLAVP